MFRTCKDLEGFAYRSLETEMQCPREEKCTRTG